MSEGERISLADAERFALGIVELLRPYCTRIEIAGSIRRRKSTVGDIEIVAAPKFGPLMDLWGNLLGETVDRLDERCTELRAMAIFAARERKGRGAWGPKYKKIAYEGFPVDLFSVISPAQFGVVYLIRTGPAEFSHRFVMQRQAGGMMPEWAHVRDGAIRHFDGGDLYETPEEGDVWKLLGLAPIPPEERR